MLCQNNYKEKKLGEMFDQMWYWAHTKDRKYTNTKNK